MNKLKPRAVGTAAVWLMTACGGTVDLEGGGKGSTLTMTPSSSGEGGSANSADNGSSGSADGGNAVSESYGGAPVEASAIAQACQHYCEAYTTVCPDAGHGSSAACTSDCVSGLAHVSNACRNGKQQAFECIATALMRDPTSCADALVLAESTCGNADANVPACHEECEPLIHGGSGASQADASCEGHTVTLQCQETVGTGTPCQCLIDGTQVFELQTGFDNAKSATEDQGLFQLCLSKL